MQGGLGAGNALTGHGVGCDILLEEDVETSLGEELSRKLEKWMLSLSKKSLTNKASEGLEEWGYRKGEVIVNVCTEIADISDYDKLDIIKTSIISYNGIDDSIKIQILDFFITHIRITSLQESNEKCIEARRQGHLEAAEAVTSSIDPVMNAVISGTLDVLIKPEKEEEGKGIGPGV